MTFRINLDSIDPIVYQIEDHGVSIVIISIFAVFQTKANINTSACNCTTSLWRPTARLDDISIGLIIAMLLGSLVLSTW